MVVSQAPLWNPDGVPDCGFRSGENGKALRANPHSQRASCCGSSNKTPMCKLFRHLSDVGTRPSGEYRSFYSSLRRRVKRILEGITREFAVQSAANSTITSVVSGTRVDSKSRVLAPVPVGHWDPRQRPRMPTAESQRDRYSPSLSPSLSLSLVGERRVVSGGNGPCT